MPTIPTGHMERELRALYLRWLAGVSYDSKNLTDKLSAFEKTSQDLIERLGGQVASLGALADFPVPKRLDLSPHVGTIYSDMQQAAIQAGIMAGLNSTDVARQMFNLGMDKSFNRLNRLARTETVSAYWKNAWDSISDLPILVMVWGSEDGPRTCEWCRERDGLVMDSPDLRDHPNGRCTPIPTLRSKVKYRGSVSRDGQIYHDAEWDKVRTSSSVTSVQEVDTDLSARKLTPFSTDKKVFPLETNDLNIIGARTDIIDSHELRLADLAKAKRKDPEALREEIEKKMQEFVNRGKPVIHVDAENLESILNKGFQSTWDNAGGAGSWGDREVYLQQRAAAEALNWKGQRPIYGMIDDGSTKGMLYGHTQVVLKDSVKDGATVTFGDSINHGANMLATPARNVGYESVRDDYLHKNNITRSWNARDLVSEYAELQMPAVSAEDIDSIVLMYWENAPKPELPESVMKLLSDKGIPVTWRIMR